MWTMDKCANPQMKIFNNYPYNYIFENNNSLNKIKQIYNYRNKPSSIQFGFNFYFNNIKSSPFSPITSPKYNNFNNNNDIYENIPISYLFKSSLGKSGYNISKHQAIKFNNGNKNGIYSQFQNINNEEKFYNIPINLNNPFNINSIKNNNYLSITKLTNVTILSDNNKKYLNAKENNVLNFGNKKEEDINYNILKNKIIQ